MNKEIMRALGFSQHVTDVELGNCPFCHNPVKQADFKDPLSIREFEISGICQSCQDETFMSDDETVDYNEYEDHYYPDEL